ncbi:MAG: hypothetical protein BroJett024_12240 [Alphaproteobacteria bacterium]|nr:MAG: hypothetical protein BroJett024_12240 [Alphaproteobacteria bacterium]
MRPVIDQGDKEQRQQNGAHDLERKHRQSPRKAVPMRDDAGGMLSAPLGNMVNGRWPVRDGGAAAGLCAAEAAVLTPSGPAFRVRARFPRSQTIPR